MTGPATRAESLSLHKLRVLVAVAEREHFSKAAEWLGISQPAVSAHVRHLERHLGVDLFRRADRATQLTKAGQLVHAYAVRLLDLAEEMEEAVAASAGLAGSLDIGASTTPGVYLLPDILARFRDGHPRMRVSVAIGNTAVITRKVRMRELQLGVIGETLRDPGLLCEPWVDDELLLVVPPRHRWAGAQIEPQELDGETVIGREEGSATDESLRNGLTSAGLKARPSMVLGDTEAIKGAVANGVGVAFVSRCAARHDLSQGRLAVCRVRGLTIRRHFQLVRREAHSLTGAEKAFIAAARQRTVG